MMQTPTKNGLQNAVQDALSKGTEKERMLAVLDCIKGYKSTYNVETEKVLIDGFMKCKNDYRNQISKVKVLIESNL